jgi:hypothetical protein
LRWTRALCRIGSRDGGVDRAARAYLTVIAHHPEAVVEALAS